MRIIFKWEIPANIAQLLPRRYIPYRTEYLRSRLLSSTVRTPKTTLSSLVNSSILSNRMNFRSSTPLCVISLVQFSCLMGLGTMEKWSMRKNRDRVSWFGRITRSMRGIGMRMPLLERGESSILMDKLMREIGFKG